MWADKEIGLLIGLTLQYKVNKMPPDARHPDVHLSGVKISNIFNLSHPKGDVKPKG